MDTFIQKSKPIILDISLIASAFFVCNEWAYIFTVVDAIECPARSATVSRRYTALADRYENAKSGIADINEKRMERAAKRRRIVSFMQTLGQQDGLVAEFDEKLWNALISMIIIKSLTEAVFCFKDGTEIPVSTIILKRVATKATHN